METFLTYCTGSERPRAENTIATIVENVQCTYNLLLDDSPKGLSAYISGELGIGSSSRTPATGKESGIFLLCEQTIKPPWDS